MQKGACWASCPKLNENHLRVLGRLLKLQGYPTEEDEKGNLYLFKLLKEMTNILSPRKQFIQYWITFNKACLDTTAAAKESTPSISQTTWTLQRCNATNNTKYPLKLLWKKEMKQLENNSYSNSLRHTIPDRNGGSRMLKRKYLRWSWISQGWTSSCLRLKQPLEESNSILNGYPVVRICFPILRNIPTNEITHWPNSILPILR